MRERLCLPLALAGIVLALTASPAVAQVVSSPFVTTTMDGSAAWFEKGADPADPSLGLLHAGTFFGLSDPQSTFLFQPYTSNNVLFLTNDASINGRAKQSGTLTLSDPQGMKTIAIAAASALAPGSQLNLTFHFEGFPDYSTTVQPPDWTIGKGLVVADGMGRAFIRPDSSINFTNGVGIEGNDARVMEIPVTLPDAIPAGVLDSIDVSLSNSGPSSVAIFGASISDDPTLPYKAAQLTSSSFNQDVVIESAAAAVPEPTAVAFLTACAPLLLRRRRNLHLSLHA